ncbi:hypothetical protein LCGC14_1877820 [marine sediment metagenome]|uniref:Uncharacterized protein n=1 Tax=marine sediment metagenome TaxID=412755 RepID=A0A0F9GR60_9ZZZZ
MTKLPPPIGTTYPTPPTPKKDLISKPEITRETALDISLGQWPLKRRSEGLGISFKDGWNFGLGFWLCSVVILGSLGCVIAMGLAVLSGGLLGGLL